MARHIIPLIALVTVSCRFSLGFTAVRPGWIQRSRIENPVTSPLHVSTLTAPPSVNMTDMGFPSSTPHVIPGFDQWTNLPTSDPAKIEIVPLENAAETEEDLYEDPSEGVYPFVNMLRGSGRYIADHQGETCVFHIPGEMLETESFGALMDDISLAWLLGLKIVIVAGCRVNVECPMDFENGHGCQNTLHVTDDKLLRYIEEEAGYVRFEVERQLNRSLRLHGGMSKVDPHSPLPSGNVVGGNFYTAKPFGVVRGMDYLNTGYASHVHQEKIQDVLKRDDIVLLTTVGVSRLGSCVNVNGNHLAASVASSLEAHKLVYFANQGTVLRKQGEEKTIQDIPVSVVKSFLDHHKVQVHRAGFASFKHVSKKLDPNAVEMLLHMGWGSWALDNGVKRAHIVNPGDGALLEELYTAKHGTNTCLYNDVEEDDDEFDDFDLLDSMLDEDQEEILFSELPNGN